MTKWISLLALSLTTLAAIAHPAAADDTAQIKACEKVKAGIEKQAAKCPDQAAEAAKLTCSASTAPQVKTLFDGCLKAMTAKKSTGAAKTVPCTGTDEAGKVLAEASAESTSKCMRALQATLTTQLCDGTASKSVKFMFIRDGGKPVKSALYCKKAKK